MGVIVCQVYLIHLSCLVKLGGGGIVTISELSYRGGICNSNNAGFVGVLYKTFKVFYILRRIHYCEYASDQGRWREMKVFRNVCLFAYLFVCLFRQIIFGDSSSYDRYHGNQRPIIKINKNYIKNRIGE